MSITVPIWPGGGGGLFSVFQCSDLNLGLNYGMHCFGSVPCPLLQEVSWIRIRTEDTDPDLGGDEKKEKENRYME